MFDAHLNLDVLGAVELTASAAVVVATVVIGFGNGVKTRLRMAGGLAAWFAVVVVLAATGAIGNERGIGAPGLGMAVFIPIIVLSTLAWRIPSLRSRLDHASLPLLTAMHAIRILGVSFLVLHRAGRLPAPFALVAGWGDILAGLAAPLVAWRAFHQRSAWRLALWIWNCFGLADLAAAVTLGVLSSPGPLRLIFAEPDSGIMSSLPWLLIPGFIVPLLALTHLAIFYRLCQNPWRADATHGGIGNLAPSA